MTTQPVREGFHSVTPYLLIEEADRLIGFLREAFGADVLCRETREDGSVMHAELRIGDSMLMAGEATDEFGPMPMSLYLYVPDCDATYQQALEAGGASVFEVMDMPSGERYGGIRDPAGNIWWIATHVEDVPPAEQARRWREFQR
jgi:PhnB protein